MKEVMSSNPVYAIVEMATTGPAPMPEAAFFGGRLVTSAALDTPTQTMRFLHRWPSMDQCSAFFRLARLRDAGAQLVLVEEYPWEGVNRADALLQAA